MPNDTGFVPRQARADIVEIALAGLTATPKTLPAMLFYDDEGCRLFYEITRLPEYYLTRTEIALLRSIAATVVPDGFRDGVLVEFGGSDETKARILFDRPDAPFSTYVSIDVAAPALDAMRARLRQTHHHLTVVTIVADFMQPLLLPPLGSPRMGFFPGSTIGNLDPAAATAFLASARISLGAGSWFLLGADLRKSPKVLLPAYNDAAGVTAAFNLNLLRRLNREAGADFDLNAFRHEAVWNDGESRIEMHLTSTRDQMVHIGGHSIAFREAEIYSHREQLQAYAGKADGDWSRCWLGGLESVEGSRRIVRCDPVSRGIERGSAKPDYSHVVQACAPPKLQENPLSLYLIHGRAPGRSARRSHSLGRHLGLIAHQIRAKLQSGTMYAAFQGADRATGLLRGIFVRLLLQHDHEQSLTLFRRQAVHRPSQFTQRCAILMGGGHRDFRHIFHVGEFALAAHTTDKVVDHYPVNPRGKVGSWDEAILSNQRLGRDILSEVVGGGSVSR